MPQPSPTNADFFDQLRAAASGAAPAAAPIAPVASAAPAQTGDFFDSLKQQVATPAAKTSNPTIGQELSAPFQAAASLATGLVAPAGAAAENLITGKTSPADYAAARTKWQYSPTNPVAQADVNAATWLPRHTIGAVTGLLGNAIGNHSGGLMSPLQATDTLNTGLMALPGMDTSSPAAAAATKVSPEVQAATQAGFKLTPEQAGAGIVGRTAQGLAGSAKLERSVSKQNAPVVNNLAATEVGAPSVKTADLSAAKAPANAVYKAASTAGSVPLDPASFSGVKAPGTLVDPAVAALQQHYTGMGSIDAGDLISDVRQLRASASKNIKAPFAPSQNSLGWAQKQAADGLENSLDQHLQSLGPQAPVSIQDFRNARQQLAKIHSVQDATKAGNVSARALAQQQAKGVPLSGNLKTIADAYNNFDRSFQDVSKIRDSGPVNFADLLVGGLAAIHEPAAAAAMFARPLARNAIASNAYQNRLAGRPLVPAQATGLLGQAGASMPLLNQQQPQGLLR